VRRGLVALALVASLLTGGGPAAAEPVTYAFVDHLTVTAPSARPVSAAAAAVRQSLTPATLEADVRVLAAPELRGRLRGTEENARGRGHIIERLKVAGMAPLFDGAYEQPTFADGERHGTNVGAVYRAARPDAEWIVLVAHLDHLGGSGDTIHYGADDNASSVALLLALADGLGRARPALPRHVVLFFPDAEEPPDIRTARMGSSFFWQHPPLSLERLHLALVFDLMGGRAGPLMQASGLANALFLLGAEAGRELAEFARSQPAADGVETVFLSLPTIEAMPYVPSKRYARSDYHGLREHRGRPFLFVSTGRTETYHTPRDTADTLDYAKLGRVTGWVAVLAVHAAEAEAALDWRDFVVDPRADARGLLRMSSGLDAGPRFPWLLRRALAADRRWVEETLRRWDAGGSPTPAEYRRLQLVSLRIQAAIWRPSGWYFALW
jgi:hypothetical protein